MTNSAYPNGMFSWSDRIDEVDIDYAGDINSVAAEVVSTEKTLGLLPQVQKNPMLGPPITFANVDQRLDYITAMAHIPVCQLTAETHEVPNYQYDGRHWGRWNQYTSTSYDPFGMFNGSDMTCLIGGFYIIDISQFWSWWGSGYHACHFWIDEVWHRSHRWDWDFPGNREGGQWRGGPQWNIARQGHSHITWMGMLNQGQRLRVISENGTSNTTAIASNLHMSAALLRRTPAPDNLMANPVNPAIFGDNPPTVTRYLAPDWYTWGSTRAWDLFGGHPRFRWHPVQSPNYAESYTVAIYYTDYPNGLAHLETVLAPGVVPDFLELVLTGLPSGSYQAHIWANGGMVDPAHAIIPISF